MDRFKDAALRALEEKKIQELKAQRVEKVKERDRIAEATRQLMEKQREEKRVEEQRKQEQIILEQEKKQALQRQESARREQETARREQQRREEERKAEEQRQEQARKAEEQRQEAIREAARREQLRRDEERRLEEQRREEQRRRDAEAAEQERLRLEALKLPPPECFRCKHPIHKSAINAAGKFWHKEHFVCYQCDQPLLGGKFYDKDGQLYCDSDYLRLFARKCSRCRQPILAKVIEANGLFFHADHLLCLECDAPLDAGFRESLGLLYCPKHADGPKTCFGCRGKIQNEEVLIAMGRTWHEQHFKCCECQQPPPHGSFCERDGKAYCEKDFDRLFSPKCHECRKPITGRVVSAMGVQWHAEHFVCTQCKTSLTGGVAYRIRDDKPYCEQH
eukprot:TRINITY_DN122_c0_g1_i3.p1 TRINITY_DN122_c0_g1~~TRINITY_DN122_c0_g1_i3.p1  ORF type:complete len:392 (-),score=80.57 TRINITY_DN122_c0_g1_i3:121-1296(-)